MPLTGTGAEEDGAPAAWMAAESGGAPLVAVVEPADLWKLHDLADGRRLGGPGLGRVLAEAEVGSGPVIVDEVLGDDAMKVAGLQSHDVIVALAPNAASQGNACTIWRTVHSAVGLE